VLQKKKHEAHYINCSGLGDSGETHWQNYWLQHFETSQKSSSEDWDNPLLKDWLKA
jgi:predicted alpha/beta hydrolase family esterase